MYLFGYKVNGLCIPSYRDCDAQPFNLKPDLVRSYYEGVEIFRQPEQKKIF